MEIWVIWSKRNLDGVKKIKKYFFETSKEAIANSNKNHSVNSFIDYAVQKIDLKTDYILTKMITKPNSWKDDVIKDIQDYSVSCKYCDLIEL